MDIFDKRKTRRAKVHNSFRRTEQAVVNERSRLPVEYKALITKSLNNTKINHGGQLRPRRPYAPTGARRIDDDDELRPRGLQANIALHIQHNE